MQATDVPLRLRNTVQTYDWGAYDAIPRLLGDEPDGTPRAELWLGAHPSAPSRTDPAGDGTTLHSLIRSAPDAMLGKRVADEFGPRLPYLLKVLAARRALSLQVHPKPHTAREGFNRENRLGLPAGSAKRSFHDDQHKPEMLVALTQFEGLAGLRGTRAALTLLDGLGGKLVDDVVAALRADRSAAGMRAAFDVLIRARQDAGCRSDIEHTVDSVRERLAGGSPFERADRTVVDLADQHPGDPGAVASLLMNRFTLEPGEALFTPAGELHAYLSGVGTEIMASSDNVLRAGLTSKLVDAGALMECASFAARPPVLPDFATSGSRGQVQTYRAPVAEFALTLADVDPGEDLELPDDGPRIVLCLDGEVALSCGDGSRPATSLAHGDSVFVPDAAGALTLTGAGHVVCAWVP
ncbi:mannose-6-phosphate isomerase, class I [Myceligenerans xiligouense]|uniref:mannose-6-phosphate isomerase n=1 Tax=Myceligenerans xiligouense TaxID=253184 RepID=A0A3N4ZJK1_9MICO|nr:mannose-6-phosphate isomerase, class I [Myceligenerans xiligouense]RPF20111.1 mannose-6-phosphate isomerase type 1 [Myceligenerans xiligouense]